MGLLLGGVLLLWLAAQRDSMPLFLIAGLSFGAVTMAHVDGMIIQLSVVGYLIVALLAAAPARRRRTVGRLTAFVVGDAATTALGLLDLQWLSPGYYHDRHHDLGRIALAAAALAIAGLVAVTATWLWPMLRHWWSTSASRPVSIAGAAFLVAAFTVLATRPWWLVARNHHVFPSDTVYISSLQRGQHLSVDPTRVYTELTMNWISWYTGWLTIGLGILGLAWWVWRGLRRPDLATLALPLVVLVPALLYLNHPAIDPDQLWATRRLLWAVYPGMFLAAAVAIGWLVGKRRMLVAVAAALSIVVAGYPLLATRHLFRARVGFPLLTQTERICRTIGPHAALALAGPYGAEYLGALRSYCDVPAGNLRSLNQPTLAALAQAVAAHGRTLYVVSAAPLAAANGQPLPVFNTVTFKFWDAVLTVPAKNFGVAQNAVVLARVAPDGALTPVPG
jgi:hypothetical protein